MVKSLAAVLLVAFLAGCGGPSRVELPGIRMTSGGGFEGTSREWTIAPDGSWTWVRKDKSMRLDAGPSLNPPPRTGRLTEKQRTELAVLAIDPLLLRELRRSTGRCEVSDGPDERLEVGDVHYVASWCKKNRPHIDHLRARIRAFTTAG
jgi:hypothetical protein